MKIKILVIFFVVLIYLGCNFTNKQSHYLLPETCSVKEVLKKHEGITTFYIYNIDGKIDTAQLYQFPINKLQKMKKECVRWHKPDSIEIINIQNFILELQTIVEIKNDVNQLIKNENVFISYFLQNDDIKLNNKEYEIFNWIDLYVLDIFKEKIYYIKFGEF